MATSKARRSLEVLVRPTQFHPACQAFKDAKIELAGSRGNFIQVRRTTIAGVYRTLRGVATILQINEGFR